MSYPLARGLAVVCAVALAGPTLAQTKAPPKPGAETTKAAGASAAKAAGTISRASGIFPCARSSDQPMAQCRFGVVRTGGGDGRVTVAWPGGGERVIVFAGGAPTSFERTAPEDAATKMTVQRDTDLYLVTIGTERFQIPDVVITGG